MPRSPVAPPSCRLFFRDHDAAGGRALRAEVMNCVEARRERAEDAAVLHAPTAGEHGGGEAGEPYPCHNAQTMAGAPIAQLYGANAYKRPRLSSATRESVPPKPPTHASAQ